MGDIDTSGTRLLVCPYCGHEHEDSWEFKIEDGSEVDCGECGRLFFAESFTSVTYYSEKLEQDAHD
ncbi:hypothetical protein AA0311_1528 [Asaia bogorensis NBRC 16594]|uniref:Uncharacterized protein n=1 Tax=Asaia bogorensis NBRC 16594 TaxID=1231624 RepID=A0AAN4R7F5_9PROT|nr:hypothetical protein AA0311_1528 [Asaia bogorensis NBRC 16594]GEL54379.1 hypothetical protein ABO01nite_23860 [Asaia bogorensis NBRC 16594]